MRRVPVTLLAIPASHACATAEAMLNAKQVPYQRVDLIPALHRGWLRLIGFAGVTVPAVRIDGARVQGTRQIARALDAAWPQPPLFPADPAARARIERIEAWGEGPLQTVARRIILWALLHSHEGAVAALDGAHLQFRTPLPVAAAIASPILRADAALQGAHANAVRADLALLPDLLDKADAWVTAGDLGADPPTAADYQLAGSIRMLLTIQDLATLFTDRPITRHARQHIPRFPGHVPAGVLPAAWQP
jgi:glutathione S-transferase